MGKRPWHRNANDYVNKKCRKRQEGERRYKTGCKYTRWEEQIWFYTGILKVDARILFSLLLETRLARNGIGGR
jgi:hypothetical protein